MRVLSHDGIYFGFVEQIVNKYTISDDVIGYIYHPIDYLIIKYNDINDKSEGVWENFAIKEFREKYMDFIKNKEFPIFMYKNINQDIVDILASQNVNIDLDKINKDIERSNHQKPADWKKFPFYNRKFFTKLEQEVHKTMHWSYFV